MCHLITVRKRKQKRHWKFCSISMYCLRHPWYPEYMFMMTSKIQRTLCWSIVYLLPKFNANPSITAWVIPLTNKQTNKQTDRQTDRQTRGYKYFTKHKPHACPAESPLGSNGMVPSTAAWRYLQPARSIPSLSFGDRNAQHVFVTGDLDLWPWHSNSSERAKCLRCEFGANPFSMVPEIFYSQRKEQKKQKCYTQR